LFKLFDILTLLTLFARLFIRPITMCKCHVFSPFVIKFDLLELIIDILDLPKTFSDLMICGIVVFNVNRLIVMLNYGKVCTAELSGEHMFGRSRRSGSLAEGMREQELVVLDRAPLFLGGL
jgi:hypothetical protein